MNVIGPAGLFRPKEKYVGKLGMKLAIRGRD